MGIFPSAEFDGNAAADGHTEFFFDGAKEGVRLRIGDFFFLFLLFTGQVFDVTGRETFVYDLFRKPDLLFAGRKSEERARLAGRELAFDHELFHFIWEIRKTEHIGDVGAAFADSGSHLSCVSP